MLVLALQFSRCDVTHAELADPDVAPGRPARRSGVGEVRCCQLPQNGREDGGHRGPRSREGPNPCDLERLARQPHQCTNWDCLAPHGLTSANGGETLLRKEVIQPHLPVRLPCYDFTPITDPTFDGSLPCGLGHRLRVLPTFVV
jgi:hypothetical protein